MLWLFAVAGGRGGVAEHVLVVQFFGDVRRRAVEIGRRRRITSVRPPLWPVMSFSAPTLTFAIACGSGVSIAIA